MRWQMGRRSDNIEDRRGIGVPLGVAGGGLGTIVVLLLALFFGFDPSALLQGGGTAPAPTPDPRASAPVASGSSGDAERDFVSAVLADTEDTWAGLFDSMHRRYVRPRLVLFSTAIDSACGMAGAATGPFYCPADHKVYLDLAFFEELRRRFHAPGDFAQAYVIAHEIGHHVQSLFGITDRVARARSRADRAQANALSVRLELQADCLAGVWAHHADAARGILEAGDVDEALGAAAAVGDDRIQRQTRGRVSPESFTHGSAAQRTEWFERGLTSGEVAGCDTFAAG